ncbi:MAG: peptidoglycan D,D-transpeptidase FtsI family protein [Roseibacillus sp.]
MNKGLQARVLIVCLALVAGLSALSGRLIYLQWDSEEDAHSSSPGRSIKRPLLAQNGYIVDRNEEVIARNNPVTEISVDLNHLTDATVVAPGVAYARAVLREEWSTASEHQRDQIVGGLSDEVLKTRDKLDIVQQHLSLLASILTPHLKEYPHRDDLLEKVGPVDKRINRPLILAKKVPEEISDKIQAAARENRIQGLIFRKSYRRIYPNPKLGAHVVGIRSSRPVREGSKEEHIVGVSGIERSQAKYLQGKDGYEVTKRDARNLRLGKTSGVVKPPIPGLDVQLSLDLSFQALVEEELDAGLAFAHAKRGAIVVMNPHTGEVLAMASRPTFDLNKRENVGVAGVNYAMQAVYEPGSTFKIIATAAVIEEGLANPWTRVFCHDGECNELKPPVKDYMPFGWLSLREVLAKSSNIGTFQFAKMLGRERFYRYMDDFGFGQRTGISLGGEQAGLTPHTANNREFASRCYGYAVNVTPLQVANAYCVIANGGKLMKPLLVKSVMMPNGQRIHSFEPEMIRQVVSPQTAAHMRRALATVTEPGGTATKGAVPGFGVAGKTGTAWKVIDGGYDKNRKVASFAGMLPVENPEFVCVVVIDDPQTPDATHGGGTIAAPIFSKVAGRLASAMNLKPTRTVVQPLASQ